MIFQNTIATAMGLDLGFNPNTLYAAKTPFSNPPNLCAHAQKRKLISTLTGYFFSVFRGEFQSKPNLHCVVHYNQYDFLFVNVGTNRGGELSVGMS